jgi:DNA-binding beta-propeller fold protein YncE
MTLRVVALGVLFGGVLALGTLHTGGIAWAADAPYRLARVVPLPGDDGWDYLAFDAQTQRLFISHGTRVLVMDTRDFTVVGEIADTPGVHGIALAPALGRGYVSAGRTNVIVEFDLKTLARIGEIQTTGENPDAILYDPATQRVFTFNGRGRNVTAVDAKSGVVVGTIPLDAKPEFAVSDERGHVYVNLEDQNSIAQLDARTLAVSAVWPLGGCEEPSGLALDRAGRRLFAVCANRVMAVVDANSGRLLGSAPIGAGPDAAAYDAHARLALASCGEGLLSVVALPAVGAPTGTQPVPTQRGARTMALDAEGGRLFLVTADFGAAAAPTAEHPHPRPPQLPGTFRLLLVERAASSGSRARGQAR